jgi:hypothetical protein
MKTQGSFQQ